MRTFDYLIFDPVLRSLMWPGVIAGLAIALTCALLSPLAVLKRLSFAGQGVSHAAFGGIGLAALLGFFAQRDATAQFLIVLGFCAAAALLIASLIRRGSTEADTAIGIVLVGSMTLGALLTKLAYDLHRAQMPSWESILFGSIATVGPRDALSAWLVAAATVAVLFFLRRPLLFWAFDEPAATAFGVNPARMKFALILLLALAIVTAMKLAGVVLATALLVLPGATALRLSASLVPVFALSAAAGVAAVLAGLVLSFELDLPPGASIVAAMLVLFAAAAGWRYLISSRVLP